MPKQVKNKLGSYHKLSFEKVGQNVHYVHTAVAEMLCLYSDISIKKSHF